MVKIYINNVLQKAEILPADVPTLDETLETFSFALISNTNPLPLAPMQSVKVDFTGDNSDVAYFYIVSDSVETYSLNPLRYKHSVSCIQNTRKLSKHLVRNSSFTQPFYLQKSSFNTEKRFHEINYNTSTQQWHGEFTNIVSPTDSLNYNSQPLVISANEHLSNAKLKISFQYGASRSWGSGGTLYANDKTPSQIFNRFSNYSSLSILEHFTLKYKNANNQDITRQITPSDFGETEFNFNKTYEFPLINELAQQGCNSFEILFDALDMVSATFIDVHDTSSEKMVFWCMQVSIEGTVYYYNCYDILDLLIKRQQKATSIRYDLPLFALPQSGDLYNLLKNTPAPNFTFTQLTMYECVAEVFRLFDAIFTMDDEGVLGIEYFNDLSNETVDGGKFVGRTLSLGEDKYTNGLIANYQDARIVESFPKKEGDFAGLRSVEFGVPDAQDHNFIVPHNIDVVKKCEIIIDSWEIGYETVSGGSANWQNNTDIFRGSMVLDITDYVLEQTAWSMLATQPMSDSDFDNLIKKKTNCVYYAKGDNKIQLGFSHKSNWFMTKYVLQNACDTALIKIGGYHSHGSGRCRTDPDNSILKGDWKEIRMRVTYVSTTDGKTEVHSITNKYNGETLIDQANGAVDLNKFGLNMLGLSLKLGNPTLNATHKITSWANRIKTGQLYNYQGRIWVANVVHYTFLNGYIQGKVSFVQNFNQLALRTQLLREKRMSNISQELVQKSEDIITDFIYYSTNPSDFWNVSALNGDSLHFNFSMLHWFFRASFDVDLSGNYYDGIKLGDAFIHYNIVESNQLYMIYIPMVRYGAGNTINFEMSFDHPMNAGNRTTYIDGHYYTDHLIYTDEEGYVNYVNIRFPKYTDPYSQIFPMVTMDVSDHTDDDDFLNIYLYAVYKQPNEIFALNYQLALLPYTGREQTDFIGSEFINNNAFVKDINSGKVSRYICFLGEKSSVLDTRVSSYLVKKPLTSVQNSTWTGRQDKFAIVLNYSALTTAEKELGPFKSWAIVDENSNILFASNSETDLEATQKTIYFITKLHRFN